MVVLKILLSNPKEVVFLSLRGVISCFEFCFSLFARQPFYLYSIVEQNPGLSSLISLFLSNSFIAT